MALELFAHLSLRRICGDALVLAQRSLKPMPAFCQPRLPDCVCGFIPERESRRSFASLCPVVAVVRVRQVRKVHTFVKDRHSNAVFLETVVVSRALVGQLEALADGAIAEASWFEVMPSGRVCALTTAVSLTRKYEGSQKNLLRRP